MPNGNGKGPMNAGSKSGRGLGFCSGSGMPGRLNRETVKDQTVVEQQPKTDYRGQQECGNGIRFGNGSRNGGCSKGRGQR
ncbi:MAG: DUF5320 domain-containing protein [Deltaproteobacteria bacterium]|jgi:hypothetical protein|nr:DUF5320 domain-containing protein [Deltaproteobacteria bacterium]